MSERRLRSLVREGFVIILSILLAFAIDAWWGRTLEREAEADLITEMVEDFTALGVELDTAILKAEDATTRAGSFFRAKLQGLDQQPIDSLDHWFLSIGVPVDVHLETPALDAVVATGSLALTSDATLRSALADFRAARRTYSLMLEATKDAVLVGPEMAAARQQLGGLLLIDQLPPDARREFYDTNEASAALEVIYLINGNIGMNLREARTSIDVILDRLDTGAARPGRPRGSN